MQREELRSFGAASRNATQGEEMRIVKTMRSRARASPGTQAPQNIEEGVVRIVVRQPVPAQWILNRTGPNQTKLMLEQITFFTAKLKVQCRSVQAEGCILGVLTSGLL